jgi:hypothetical protein
MLYISVAGNEGISVGLRDAAGNPITSTAGALNVNVANTTPISVDIGSVLDPLNSSDVPLAGYGSFTGAYVDVTGYSSVNITASSDQFGVVLINWSNDGVNLIYQDSLTIGMATTFTGGAITGSFTVKGKYYQVQANNSSSNPQTNFALSSVLQSVAAAAPTYPLNGSSNIEDGDPSVLTSTFLYGKDPSNSFQKSQVFATGGALNVNVTNGSVVGSNPSVGPNNVLSPTSSTLIGAQNGTLLVPLSTDSSGNLNVNLAAGTVVASNPSVGPTGTTPPTSATLIGGMQGSPMGSNLVGINITSSGAVQVDGSGATQPISALYLPLPMGAATESTLGSINTNVSNLNTKINNNPYQNKVLSDIGNDIFNAAVVGQKYNQIEIDFNTAPGATLITNTTGGGGTITQANGQSTYATSISSNGQAKSVSVQTLNYRPGNESFVMFTASFTVSAGFTTSYQRIGLYDANNGFYIGFEGRDFGITKRTAGVNTFISQANFNGDKLDGLNGSKFTRDGYIEPINFGYSNLFRIRFGWLGSASIIFEIMSPDGNWVIFNTIKQPNSAQAPSLTNPNLPMTIDANKNGSGSGIAMSMTTTCWAAGTTSGYVKITDVLTDNSLASITRSVITGVTTGGGGGYVNVKVNPSGSLVTDSTVSGTVAATQSGTWNINNISGTVSLPTGAATETTLSSLNTKVTTTANGIKVDGSAATQPISAAALPLPSGAATSANQTNGTQTTRVTDGTNTAAVKAASTAAVATDPALVVAISPNNTVAATQSGTWNINNISGTISLPTLAATSTKQSDGSQKTQIVDGSGNVIASTSNAMNVSVTNTSIKSVQTNSKGEFVRNDYTSTSVSTSAYTQLIASTANTYSTVEIFDSSGQTLVLAIGGAGSEVNQFIIFPGGNGRIPYTIASGSRISIKALSATANAGEIDINFYV